MLPTLAAPTRARRRRCSNSARGAARVRPSREAHARGSSATPRERHTSRVVGLLALSLSACGPNGGEPLHVERGPVLAPALADRGDLCSDVGALRVCWESACPGGVCVEPRPVPAGLAPSGGFRCHGRGRQRRCESRRAQAGPFHCDDQGSCVQHHARAPDDGEWECVETHGVVQCRSAGDAAGIGSGPTDAGYLCGPRRGAHAGERICVDFAPDPPSDGAGWSCTVRYQSGRAERVCRQSEQARVGDRCTRADACPGGTGCVSGFCLPPRPEPACWFDADCGASSRCRFGSCVGAP